MSPFLVNRCVCQKRSFEEIKEYATAYEITDIKQLQAKEICSNKCHMCAPYVELMLVTGETSFEPGAYIQRKQSS